MAAKTSKISVALSANAKDFKKELGKAEKDVGKFSKGASKAFDGLKMAGIGIAAGLGAAFVKAGLDFEAMENILIKGTGATGQALEDLKTQATDVLRTVPETAEVVAGAIADVNTFFGATGDQLEATTGLFLDFARITDMDVGDAIARLDAQMTQFNIPLEDTDELLGDLVRISQATGAPMDNLLGQMEKFGPIFATAAFSGEETIAMFGMLEQAGVDVTKLGPSLEKFFADVAEGGGDPRQAFEDIVSQIQSATSETDALAIASEAFGTAGARMTSAIRSGNFELETFGGLMGEGTGLVDAQADATETLSDKFAILKNDLMARLGPAAVATMEGMVVAIDAVIVAVEATVAAIQVAAAWIADDFFPMIRPVIDLVVRWFDYMGDQIENVVDLVVALFQGDFAAAFDALKDIATTAVDFMVDTFKDLPGLLFRAAVEGLKLLTSLGEFFGKAIVNGLIEMWNKADLTFPRIDVPSWVPGIGGKGFGGFDVFPDIPTLAAGGIVTGPTLALVGEAGPEAIIPLDRAGGGMGGAPMTVNVYLPVGSDGDAVVRALQEYEARNGPVPVGTRSL
jgi:TP901 family phage tail tape measure protein